MANTELIDANISPVHLHTKIVRHIDAKYPELQGRLPQVLHSASLDAASARRKLLRMISSRLEDEQPSITQPVARVSTKGVGADDTDSSKSSVKPCFDTESISSVESETPGSKAFLRAEFRNPLIDSSESD